MEQAGEWGLSVRSPELESLLGYADLLVGYVEANVIGTRDLEAVLLDHVLDSLSCFLHGPLRQAESLADIGSGGGLPAVPVKVMRPHLNATLVESTGKKARFLDHARGTLSLGGVRIINRRAEEVGRQPDHRDGYDVVTARALASLPVLAEYCLPLARKGGHVIAMKASPTEQELEEGECAARALGGRVEEIISVPLLPQMRARNRKLVILEKVHGTPSRYPRKPGAAKKHPLGGR